MSPLFIITIGFPGSGKTYFSEHLAKEFSLFHLSRDKLRHEVIDSPNYQPPEQEAISRGCKWIAEEFLRKGVGVIYDGNFTKKKYRDDMAQLARDTGARFLIAHIETPVEIAEERLVERKKITSKEKQKYYRPIDKDVLHFIKDDTDPLEDNEPVVTIDGMLPFGEQLKTLQEYLGS